MKTNKTIKKQTKTIKTVISANKEFFDKHQINFTITPNQMFELNEKFPFFFKAVDSAYKNITAVDNNETPQESANATDKLINKTLNKFNKIDLHPEAFLLPDYYRFKAPDVITGEYHFNKDIYSSFDQVFNRYFSDNDMNHIYNQMPDLTVAEFKQLNNDFENDCFDYDTYNSIKKAYFFHMLHDDLLEYDNINVEYETNIEFQHYLDERLKDRKYNNHIINIAGLANVVLEIISQDNVDENSTIKSLLLAKYESQTHMPVSICATGVGYFDEIHNEINKHFENEAEWRENNITLAKYLALNELLNTDNIDGADDEFIEQFKELKDYAKEMIVNN